MQSWLHIPSGSHFSLANIPFGVISSTGSSRRPAVAIGEYALDLKAFAAGDGFSGLPALHPHLGVFDQPTLNALAATGHHRNVRLYIQSILSDSTSQPGTLKANQLLRDACLLPLSDVTAHVPFQIGDYTDFYAGLNHAFNVGVLFRGAANALQPNYMHLPVAYHGRASTVVASGTPIRRPRGQVLPQAGATAPMLAASAKLDFELELGAFVSRPSAMGRPVGVGEAQAHVFGLVLLNDWSARDVQAWEYVPLGPFGAKNFGSTVSPWVVTLEALEPFRAKGLRTDDMPPLLPYLVEPRQDTAYDIRLEVEIKPKGAEKGEVISKTSGKNLLYSFQQMLVHHTITGCAMSVGDLLGSGTISGTEPGTQGSLIEQNKNGKETLVIAGKERMFLEDGDEVTIRGLCGEEGAYVGFGECKGVILPALDS